MEIKEINIRYSQLAESECCLSCGGALEYAEAKLGEVCVDLGSGRGTDAIRMAEVVGIQGFVYGVDISDGMLQKARNNANKLNVKNVKFINCQLEKIELPDNIADLIISNCTLNHALDKQAVWNEIYRVLKKGGRFAISDIYAVNEIDEEYKNDPVAVAECWAGAILREEYLKMMVNAGFTNIEIIEESIPYSKGKALVASFTIAGKKPLKCACSN